MSASQEETKAEDTVETEEESVTESEPDISGSDSDLDAQLSGGDPLKCRMYQSDYPSKGDLVIVEVKKIVEMGAYCNLLEYNNLEGTLFNDRTAATLISLHRLTGMRGGF